MEPSNTRAYTAIPRCVEYEKSKISARASPSPTRGAGIRSIIASSNSSTPSPVLPDTARTVDGSTDRSSASSSDTSSTRDAGASIFERTGIMVQPAERAIASVVKVCACTPCVESTSRITPSTAERARDTSYAKSMWPGVSIRLKIYSTPSRALYCIRAGCILMVIPRSRSRSILSKTWSRIFRASIVPVRSRSLSARVDFP